jgi:hypothetical protein
LGKDFRKGADACNRWRGGEMAGKAVDVKTESETDRIVATGIKNPFYDQQKVEIWSFIMFDYYGCRHRLYFSSLIDLV